MFERSVLRAKRIEKGLTLDEVCLLSTGKVTGSQLSRAERGLYRLSQKEMEAVCAVLGIAAAEATASIQHVADRTRAALHEAVA
jgi:hypothetical protein